jgi:2-polyprenyl-3-methyl-5-hydroxy-6-metoxy-1,4-benzoquinol methylase
MSMAIRLAKAVLLASQRVPAFRRRPSYSSLAPHSRPAERFARELRDSRNFRENVRGVAFASLIAGKHVLDFGSGYGGRTAWMADCAASVVGIEVVEGMVQSANACVRDRRNCRFVLGKEHWIAFPDDTFDVVSTFDVLEHVRAPHVMLRQFYRMLKPGGLAIIVFTPYWGAFSHHLNYVSLAPGLHWIFSPETLMAATSNSRPVRSPGKST